MKHTKEYAVLAVVIVALGLYLFLHDRDRSTYTLPELATVATEDITKIEIAKDDGTVVLTRRDDQWEVSPGNYPADSAKVERLLTALADLDVTALISETRNYGRYELDDQQRIGVTAYRNGNTLREFGIGKAADTMRHTHILLAGNPNVYHARGNFRNDFAQTVASLRDKTVLAFDADAVTAFAVETDEIRVTVTKVEAAGTESKEEASSPPENEQTPAAQWRTDTGRVLEDEIVERLLGALSGLRCRAYLAGRPKEGLGDPTHRIRIEAQATSRLDVFPAAEETATEVPASSSLREDPFTLADFDIDPIEAFVAAVANGDNPPPPEE